MSWQDEAVPVVDGKIKPSWMDEAVPAQHNPNADTLDLAGIGQAALEHFGNKATFDYLPHLQAILGKVMPNPGAAQDDELRAQGFKVPNNDESYLKLRDENLKRIEKEGKDHPVASAAGSVAGLGANMLLTGAALPGAGSPLVKYGAESVAGPATKAATLANDVVHGAKTGALIGGVSNPGDVENEISPVQLGGRLKGAAIGGAIGAAAPAVIDKAKSVSQSVSDSLRSKAALKAARSLGRPTPTQATQMAASGQDEEIGRQLLDEGAIPFLGTPEKIQPKVEALKEKAGQEIGDIIGRGGDQKLIDSDQLALSILDSPELAQMRKTPGMESTVGAIEKQVETLSKNGQMSLKEAQALRQGIDKSINFNKASPDMRGAQEGLYQQRTAIRGAMNNAINDLPGSTDKNALLGVNKRYSNLSKAEDILERELGRNQANRGVSLTDTVAGAGGMAAGGPIGATLGAGLNKLGRTYGNSAQARTYDAISKGLGLIPGAAEKINPQSAAQAVTRATNQPEFERDSDEMLNDPRLMDLFKSDPSLIDAIDNESSRQKVMRAIAGKKR